MTTLRLVARAVCLALVCAATASAQQSDSDFIRANYTKHEYRIPMRDGVQLFTIVYVPKDASPTSTYPMVMQRTCYSVAPYGPDEYRARLGPNPFMMRGQVHLRVPGRARAVHVRGHVRERAARSCPTRSRPAIRTKIDEASDTYDTIDWLLKHVPTTTASVGQWGIRYPGFYTTMGALSAPPALVAASPQAPVTDFFFEDFHHNGALTQAYFYAYPLFGIQHAAPTPDDWWQSGMVKDGLPDDYDFQLASGRCPTTTNRYYKNNFFWQEIIQHPDYDDFWRARAVAPDHRRPPHAEHAHRRRLVRRRGPLRAAGPCTGRSTTDAPGELHRARRRPLPPRRVVAHEHRAHRARRHLLRRFTGDASSSATSRRSSSTTSSRRPGRARSGCPNALIFDTG